jgi:hypothetical protein
LGAGFCVLRVQQQLAGFCGTVWAFTLLSATQTFPVTAHRSEEWWHKHARCSVLRCCRPAIAVGAPTATAASSAEAVLLSNQGLIVVYGA